MSHISTFDNGSNGSTTVTISCVIPVTATYCTVLVGMRGSDSNATTLSGVVLGSQAFTLDNSTLREFTGFQAIEAGYILSADMPSGTLDAVATRGTGTDGMIIMVSFFDDALQVAPLVELAGDPDGGDPFNTNLTMTTGGIMVDGIITASGSRTFATNQTSPNQIEREAEIVGGGSLQSWTSTREVGSGSQTMGWSTNSNLTRTTHVILGIQELGGAISIIVNSLSQAQTIDQPNLTQAHSLVSNDLDQAQTIDQPTLTQANILGVNDLGQAQTIDIPSLTQAHILSVDDLTQNQTIDNVTLAVAGALLVDDLTQSQTIDLANIIQAHILSVNDLAQSQSIDQPSLVIGITVDDLTQAQTIDVSNLVQANILSVDDLTQAQLLSNVASGAIVVGFHKGEVLVFSAYNGIITATNAHTGKVTIFNAVDIT